MSLDRNVTEDDTGKYALIRLDKLRKMIVDDPDFAYYARKLQRPSGGSAEIPTDIIELGKSGSDDEFFVIKLRDKYASAALHAYAVAAWIDGDKELPRNVISLAERAKNHPNSHKPD